VPLAPPRPFRSAGSTLDATVTKAALSAAIQALREVVAMWDAREEGALRDTDRIATEAHVRSVLAETEKRL
jgi:hypothetical protein